MITLRYVHFINCYVILIFLTNADNRLEQTMLVIQPPGTHRLAGFSKIIPSTLRSGKSFIKL